MTPDRTGSAHVLGEVSFAGVDPDFLTEVRSWVEAPLRGCTEGAVLGAAVVLGELVTNAFRHARPPFAVRLILPRSGSVVRLEVRDGMPSPTAGWPLGKGLRVVRTLCPDWGVEHQVDGKAVWAELPLLTRPTGG